MWQTSPQQHKDKATMTAAAVGLPNSSARGGAISVAGQALGHSVAPQAIHHTAQGIAQPKRAHAKARQENPRQVSAELMHYLCMQQSAPAPARRQSVSRQAHRPDNS